MQHREFGKFSFEKKNSKKLCFENKCSSRKLIGEIVGIHSGVLAIRAIISDGKAYWDFYKGTQLRFVPSKMQYAL